MGRLLADEYEHTSRRDHLVPGTIFVNPNWVPIFVHINGIDTFFDWFGSHSSRIDTAESIAGTHDMFVTVTENFRVSALYTKTFTMQALCPNNDHTQCDGKCYMVNAPLPWSPIGFFRKLP